MGTGIVYLIGAGPGDPELLTLKGKRCLEEADVIVGDYLADRRILSMANPKAEYIYVGKMCGNHAMKQEDISRLLAEKGKEGKIVARLKGGDPFVFGRGGEEILELRKEGVPYEVVPGVTSAIAAPAYAGIPVTHRKVAASFAVVTGHEDPTKKESSIHWEKLAGGTDTLIFLMGVHQTGHIAENLMKYGRSGDTPAAFIRWGTRPYQEVYETTLAEAEDAVKNLHILPPAVFLVGDVVKLRQEMRWFDNKPLFGKRVIVTRSRSQASRLTRHLEQLGAECEEIPVISIAEPTDHFRSLDGCIEKIRTYDWVIFTSQNGVDCFFKRLYGKGLDARALGNAKIACIGPATAESLRPYGLRADCIPDGEYKAESLLETLVPQVGKETKICIPRAKEAREILVTGLRATGASVDVAEAYCTVADEESKKRLNALLDAGKADIITLTSSSTVHNLIAMAPDKLDAIRNSVLACIGPITAEACRSYGLSPQVVSDVYTIDGLVEAITAAEHSRAESDAGNR